MNRDDKDFIVQKIRTQYMEKDSSQKELTISESLTQRSSVLQMYSVMFSEQ